MTGITVWEKPNCVQCRQTKQVFDREGTVYSTADLTAEENAAKLAAFKEQGHLSAPVVETPTDTWSGFQLDKVKAASVEARASQPQMSQPGVAGPGLS